MEPTASVLSHQVMSLSNPFFSVTSPSLFIFFFYPELSLLTDPELSFPFLCGIKERARPAIRSFAGNRGFETWCFLSLNVMRPDAFFFFFFFYFFLFLYFFLFCFFSSSRWVFALSFFFLFFFLFFFTLVSSLRCFFFFFSSCGDGRDGWVWVSNLRIWVWVFCCGCGGLRLGLWWSLFAWIFLWRLWFWLRAVGGFGFLIHLDFLVEVVVVLRVVGSGGCGCGFLGL